MGRQIRGPHKIISDRPPSPPSSPVGEEEIALGVVSTLAAIPDRGSATQGEHTAAEWIARELRGMGLHARVEWERAHGTHWWPYGLASAVAALAGALHLRIGRRLSRMLAVIVGALATAAVAEDLEGSRRTLRRALPQRRSANVVAEVGDPDEARVVVIHAHHDAAHGGLMFHPLIARPGGPLPSLAPVVGAPLLVALTAATGRTPLLRGATGLAVLTAALFADSGARRPVPGANDDASGVAAVLGLARRLTADPPPRVRVVLLTTGSEESMLEGMTAFARRHFSELAPGSTRFISVDSLGWETLALRNGEGALRRWPASEELVALLRRCARDLGYELREGVRFWIPTDGLVPLRAGYREMTLGSMQPDGTYPGYHTMGDTPERVHGPTIARGIALLDAALRRM